MACRFTYNGKTYDQDELAKVLRDMEPTVAARFIPGIKAIPEAPFIGKTDAWSSLALKRMIRYASDHGYQQISWDTGAINADRYDLSKHIRELQYEPPSGTGALDRTSYILTAKDNNGRAVDLGAHEPDKLDDVVGKDVADKIRAGDGTLPDNPYRPDTRLRVLRGLDLKVGGEGMVGFYDKILPAAANKLGKKFGAKVGKSTLEPTEGYYVVDPRTGEHGPFESSDRASGYLHEHGLEDAEIDWRKPEKQTSVHTLPITDSLRQAATQEGFPLFRRPPSGAAAEPPAAERTVRLGAKTVAHLSEKYTDSEEQIAKAVQRIGERMAPQAQVHGAKALRMSGQPIWGAFINSPAFPHLIAWSLERSIVDKGRPIDLISETVRHEVIHHLRAATLIRPDEWNALTKAAKDQDWIREYDIDERYPDASAEKKLEEAVAEHFANWRTDREAIKTISDPIQRLVRSAYQRLDLFFRRVAAMAREFLGRNATASDVFSRIESGEVGRRTATDSPPTQMRQMAQIPNAESQPKNRFPVRDLGALDDPDRLRNVAFPDRKTGEMTALHVTDDIGKTRAALDAATNDLSAHFGREYDDLGPGFYASAAPQMWMGRSAGKWNFLARLTPVEKQNMVDAVSAELRKQRESRYISQNEFERAERDLGYYAEGKLDDLSWVADQPYNIGVWKPEFLQRLGIKPGTQPSVAAIGLRGRFVDLTDGGFTNDDLRRLRAKGFDGAFTRGSFSSTPQVVVWRRSAITSLRHGKTVDEALNAPRERLASNQQRARGGRVNPRNINHNPTEAQKKNGSYAKDHVAWHGLNLSIENAKGSKRRGVGKDGRPWESTLPAHYGYFKRTEGADGDHLDAYLGPHPKASHVYVVDQVDADTGAFDEHKVLINFGSERQALATYKRGFSDGRGKDRIGKVTSMTIAHFKDWLQNGDQTKPFRHSVSRSERVRDILKRHGVSPNA